MLAQGRLERRNGTRVISVLSFYVTSVGAQGGPPQNVPQWYTDSFELKLLKKWPMQEGYSDPPFPESRI